MFGSKIGNNNGLDLAYARMVNGQPQLILGEAKAGDSALTALGENYERTFARNLAEVRNSIANSDGLESGVKASLIRQIDKQAYQVELYTTIGNAAKTASRIDDALIGRVGQPINRIVTFDKIK